MAETLYGIVEDARIDLRQWAEDNPDEWDADSYIWRYVQCCHSCL